MEKKSNLTKILFIIYLIALVWIILFKLSIPFTDMGNLRSINLIPFKESLIVNGNLQIDEILMNIVIFMPLGIYMSMLFKNHTFKKKLLFVFLISFVLEVSQFILGVGASDITDIITNVLGGILGIILYNILLSLFKDSKKINKFINVIATIGATAMLILLLVLVLANI
ncbi:MAG: VanZ family protein [Bacilli bacterium]|nr:VanZ family protein [Bacilli bacterium]